MVFIQPKPKKVPEQKYKVRSHDGQCFKISKWAIFFCRCSAGNQVTEANTRILRLDRAFLFSVPPGYAG